MANINITVELQPGFYTKTNPSTWTSIITQTITESADELMEAIKEEAPVRTGRLRDSHYIKRNGNYWINIQNSAPYWSYVVMRGNDYINRGLLQFINSKIIEEKATEQLNIMGLI